MKYLAHLYPEPSAGLDYPALAAYVRENLPWMSVEVRPPFFRRAESQEALPRLAQGFARAKVRNPVRLQDSFEPLPGEVDYEKRRLLYLGPWGLLYDGLQVMALCRDLLPKQERGLGSIHLIFTDQLLGTWEESDRRYHARAAIFGFPNLLSTTGLVEAPAKPREYYLLKQGYLALGLGDAPAVLETQFQERALGHGDPRLTEALKGYIMQAVFYHIIGEAFCPEPACRLFNAHWQEEVLRAQLGGELCPRHQEMVADWGAQRRPPTAQGTRWAPP